MKINQRVNTKFGFGTIVEFERLTHPISYPLEYSDGDRIGVLLDEPTNWVCHTPRNKPYFLANDILGEL